MALRNNHPIIYAGSRFGYFPTITTPDILTEGLLTYQFLDLWNNNWVMEASFLVYVSFFIH